MPITKIPVVNKFGIISEKQRLEITERLCRKTVFNNSVVHKSFLAHKNPLEVTEEFVQHYNAAASETEQKRYQALALKMMARIKRRVGLNSFGIGKHVNIPVAWTELAQLIECRGTIHDECLNCLLLSLSQAPLHQNQVESLFFLAESLLFLLRTESIRQPFLRSSEIKLLKVCQLLFSRLYFHKMANHLQGCEDFKNKLSCYLQGLSDCQSLYSSYPDAHLALRFMIQVASIILANAELDINDKTNEQDAHTFLPIKKKDMMENLKPCISSRESFTSDARCPSGHTSWMSSSIHDLSPALWHSLDVWKCQNLVAFAKIPDKVKSQNSFNESIRSLLQCSSSPDNDSCWIDCVMAVTILAEGAKVNLTILKLLQNLACHCINRTYSLGESQVKTPRQSTGNERDQKKSSPTTNKENRKQHTTSQFNLLKPEEVQVDKDVTERVSGETLSNEGDTLSLPTEKTLKTSPTRMSSFSNFSSDAIILNHYINVESNFYHWHWDVAFTYTTLLGDIVLYAKMPSIQKRALLGTNKDITSKSFLAKQHQCQEKFVNLEAIDNDDSLGCFVGLFDLTFFQSSWTSPIEEENNWSWKIRFGAIQTLIRICESLSKDCGKEGLQSAAWGILYQANAMEQDPRVLEALRVGYVQSNLDIFTKSQTFQFPCTLASYLANGLVKIYLSVPCYKHQMKGRKNIVIQGGATNKEIGIEMQRTKKERSFKKHRTSLREEILIRSTWHVTPMNYNTRTTFHLRCLVEDQWRKEMIRETVKEEVNCLEGGEKPKKVCWSFWGCHDNAESLSKEGLHTTLKCKDKNQTKVFQSEQEAKRQLKEKEISQKIKEES